MTGAEEAAALLAKSREDAHVLKVLCADSGTADAIWGFHAQQATEKLLKALLALHGVHFPFTHRLLELADILTDAGYPLDSAFEPLLDLTPYAVEYRYSTLSAAAADPLDRPGILRLIEDLQRVAAASITP